MTYVSVCVPAELLTSYRTSLIKTIAQSEEEMDRINK